MSDIKNYRKVKRHGGIKCKSSSTHFHPRKWHQVPHSLGRWPGIEAMGNKKIHGSLSEFIDCKMLLAADAETN
jgi:hypothetical protein